VRGEKSTTRTCDLLHSRRLVVTIPVPVNPIQPVCVCVCDLLILVSRVSRRLFTTGKQSEMFCLFIVICRRRRCVCVCCWFPSNVGVVLGGHLHHRLVCFSSVLHWSPLYGSRSSRTNDDDSLLAIYIGYTQGYPSTNPISLLVRDYGRSINLLSVQSSHVNELVQFDDITKFWFLFYFVSLFPSFCGGGAEISGTAVSTTFVWLPDDELGHGFRHQTEEEEWSWSAGLRGYRPSTHPDLSLEADEVRRLALCIHW